MGAPRRWAGGVLLVVAACLPRSAAPVTPAYDVHLRVDPEGHRIDVRATVRHPPGATLYLNERVEIRRLTSSGVDVPYQWDRTAAPLPYTQHGRPLHLQRDAPDELTIEYGGVLPDVENGVNQVAPGLVELAYYACWYPTFPDGPTFTFELETDLPPGLVATTNGRLVSAAEEAGRRVATWESLAPVSDIVLVASPGFRTAVSQQESLRAEVYYTASDTAVVELRLGRLERAMHEMCALYGPPILPGLLRFVYAPRPGWGYSRMPLFVVSEEYARSLGHDALGEAREFHGAVHELAHFWWMLADASTPDDWINEGLAEYSALRMSCLLFGTSFRDVLLEEYRAHAASAPADLAIAQTPSGSEARYVNRYEKTTLVLSEASARFGQQGMDGVLRSLYSRFARTRGATTGIFLDEAGSRLGAPARAWLHDCLHQPGWQPAPGPVR